MNVIGWIVVIVAVVGFIATFIIQGRLYKNDPYGQHWAETGAFGYGIMMVFFFMALVGVKLSGILTVLGLMP